MIINTDHLTNHIHSETMDVVKTGFPLDVFPDSIQKIVYELVTYENFNLEYTASCMLSAISTALGNTHRLTIKGKWAINSALYMILVGRPGLGKTPPLNYLYRPIREVDKQILDKARSEYEQTTSTTGRNSENRSDHSEKPRFPQTIISDFTQEAMMSVHYDNPRGIVLLVDEIIALFNSAKRYSGKSTLIQDLLSAYSGNPLKTVRKSEDFPLTIPIPCINIVGSTQPGLLSEIMTKEFLSNGLIDRFLFVYPKNGKIPEWPIGLNQNRHPDIMGEWSAIINKVLDIPLPAKDKGMTIEPKGLNFTDEAALHFYNWNNRIIKKVNSIENDKDVDSRLMKLNGNAARLALILQTMKWAVGECSLNCVDLQSVKGAIRLIEYFEDSYKRIHDIIRNEYAKGKPEQILDFTNDTFSSKEAENIGSKLGFSRRTVYNILDTLCNAVPPKLIKQKQGLYKKVNCTPAQCTSAEVQSANETQEGGCYE